MEDDKSQYKDSKSHITDMKRAFIGDYGEQVRKEIFSDDFRKKCSNYNYWWDLIFTYFFESSLTDQWIDTIIELEVLGIAPNVKEKNPDNTDLVNKFKKDIVKQFHLLTSYPNDSFILIGARLKNRGKIIGGYEQITFYDEVGL